MTYEDSTARTVGREKVPTILMFQPTEFELVESDKLQEFEESLKNDVGLRNFNFDKALGGGTTCKCPRKDDCDFVTLDF
jgi:hypothetical protein